MFLWFIKIETCHISSFSFPSSFIQHSRGSLERDGEQSSLIVDMVVKGKRQCEERQGVPLALCG